MTKILNRILEKYNFMIFNVISLCSQDVPQIKRQDFLKQHFHFDCHCIPCSFNWPLQRDIKTSVAKRGMADKANEIKFAYANTSKLTMHDMQVPTI